jgi:alkylation response protein AidB-like acyl-CoA dehydrogenase
MPNNPSAETDFTSGMRFEPSQEYQLIKKQIDEFIDQEVKPLEDQYSHLLGEDGARKRADEDGRAIPDYQNIRAKIRQKSAEVGFLTMHLPERVGGGGVDVLTYKLLIEHLYTSNPDSFRESILEGVTPTTLQGMVGCYDDEYQREKYFEPLMNAEKRTAFGLTEPDHGSDITWMDSTAEQRGDTWVLNGTKCFITGAPYADFFIIHARSSGDDGEAVGISSFFVDRDNPGIEVGKLQTYMGQPVSEHAFIHLNDCEVPAKNMIGEEGRGFINTAMNMVSEARLDIPAKAVGRAQWLFEQCVEYAESRNTFGEPIGNKQLVQDLLAELRVEIEQVRWLYRHAAWRIDQGEDPRWEINAAKWKGSELWSNAADTAIQIHGGAGLMSSLPFEGELRKARGMQIYDGTTQIHKTNIATNFLDL